MGYTIDLDSYERFRVDGRVIYATSLTGRRSRFVLPTGARLSLMNRGETGTLEIGGYTKITVTVKGPIDQLEDLFGFLS